MHAKGAEGTAPQAPEPPYYAERLSGDRGGNRQKGTVKAARRKTGVGSQESGRRPSVVATRTGDRS